jgi:hypothetical protein
MKTAWYHIGTNKKRNGDDKMYKCLECENIFDEGEQARWTERHGFRDGPGEEWSGCPVCRGAFEETSRCESCRGEFLDEELRGGFCEECLRHFAGNNMVFDYLEFTDQLEDFADYVKEGKTDGK